LASGSTDAGHLPNALSLDGHAGRAVEQRALGRGCITVAEHRATAGAVPAPVAMTGEGEDDVIANRDAAHVGTDLLNDSRRFMAEHHR
jgi:hypothetical protein